MGFCPYLLQNTIKSRLRQAHLIAQNDFFAPRKVQGIFTKMPDLKVLKRKKPSY